MRSKILFKRILASIIFLLGLVVILWVSSLVFIPKNNTEEAGMDEISANGILGERENTIDVLIIGDSEAMAGISPPQLWKEHGFTAYITGTTGQTLIKSNELLDKALLKQHPKIVFLESGHFFYFGIKQTIDTLTERAFPVFRYHDRWKSLTADDFTHQPEYTHVEATKGWHPSDVIDPASTENHMLPSTEREPLPIQNPSLIQMIKNKCDAIGAKLIFVRMPNTTTWTTERHNTVSDLAKTMDVPFIDMNLLLKEINFDFNTDTRDGGDHVNNTGTAKVTTFIGNYLKDLNILTDHRNDPKYDGWKKSVADAP